MHVLIHFMGLDNVSGMFYAFWSGFEPDAQRWIELAVIGGLLWYHHNCHKPGCLYLGKFPAAEGGGWKYCRRHHKTGGIHV